MHTMRSKLPWELGPYATVGSMKRVTLLVSVSKRRINKMTLMTLISDSQIVVALVSAFVTGILALRLGKELYR
uniref:Photosystem I reaction center subunit XII n=1 Tax=Closterium baillyanum TaxID=1416941 RepID=A0A191T5U3_9VIRI|nr:M polypeptide of photosystem I [Closterium baillyanum]ANI25763.1 M polypeptide of photosystem I [Closterium baillyanum]